MVCLFGDQELAQQLPSVGTEYQQPRDERRGRASGGTRENADGFGVELGSAILD